MLSKFGLADWISRLGPEFAKDLLKNRGGEAIARQGWQIRMRMALAELGPTFIKLGQVLSTRPDLVGVSLANELQHLQTQVPADPPEKCSRSSSGNSASRQRRSSPSSIRCPWHRPPSARSTAELKTGEPVVVKVQHAEIERKLEVDLDILVGLAQWAEKVPEFVNYHPRAIATEFQRTVRRELDFRRELRNMQEFARQFFGDPTVHVPRVYPQLSRSRVLVMERVDGIRLQETDRLAAAGIDLNEVARRARRCI